MKTHRIVRLSLLVSLVAVAGILAWHFEGNRIGNSSHNAATGQQQASLVTSAAVSTGQLVTAVSALDHSVYWIGPAAKPTTYELTESSNGQTFVRYLPQGVAVGTKQAYLSIGTYPMQNAFQVTKALALKVGRRTGNAPLRLEQPYPDPSPGLAPPSSRAARLRGRS